MNDTEEFNGSEYFLKNLYCLLKIKENIILKELEKYKVERKLWVILHESKHSIKCDSSKKYGYLYTHKGLIIRGMRQARCIKRNADILFNEHKVFYYRRNDDKDFECGGYNKSLLNIWLPLFLKAYIRAIRQSKISSLKHHIKVLKEYEKDHNERFTFNDFLEYENKLPYCRLDKIKKGEMSEDE